MARDNFPIPWQGQRLSTSGGSVSDGDYGDITVSSTGTVWTIDNAVVTTAKLGGDITTAGKALLDDADAAAQRTTLGLGTAATQPTSAFEVPLTFSTGLTRSTNTITVNAAQNITQLTNLTSNGFVKTGSGNGTLSVDTNTYLTGNQTITLSGDVSGSGATAITATIANDAVTYAKMQNISATSRILGRKTAAAGDTEECTLSEVLDFIGSAAQGDILYREASAWARLAAGTSGNFLQTQGAGANPQWAASTAAAGTIIQTLSTTKTDTATLSSTTFTAITGMSVSITPSSASNKVLIRAVINVSCNPATDQMWFKLWRSTTDLLIGDSAGSRIRTQVIESNQGFANASQVVLEFLDSPATTSSTTYQVAWASNGAGAIYLNRSFSDTNSSVFGRSASVITVHEVKG